MANRSYRRSKDIVSRKIADEMVLVPISNNIGDMENIYTLNDIGARIWELLDGTIQVNDIACLIAQEFEVDETQAQADVEDFLKSLEEIKALEEI